MTSEDEVLTPEESEALLEESGPESGASTPAAQGIRDADLSLWEQVAIDRIPAFEAINDDTAEAIDAIWAETCQRSIITSPKGATELTWREYSRRLEALANINMIEIQPRGELGLVVFQPATVYAMVDLFFGGTGHSERDPQSTQLTPMESRLGLRFTAALAAHMQTAWSHHASITIDASETMFDIDTTPIASPSDSVVVVTFGFDIRDTKHIVEVVWPSRLINVLKAERFASGKAGNRKGRPDWSRKLSEDLQGAVVELTAVMGEVTVRLSDIVNAEPGDIIPSESLTAVKIFAAGQPILEGTLGTHRGRNAVKIKAPVNRNFLGELNG